MLPDRTVTALARYMASRWDLDSMLDELALAGRRLIEQPLRAPYPMGAAWRVFMVGANGARTIAAEGLFYPDVAKTFDDRVLCAIVFVADCLTAKRYRRATEDWRLAIGMIDGQVVYIGAGPALEAWRQGDTLRGVETSSTRRDRGAIRKVRRRITA